MGSAELYIHSSHPPYIPYDNPEKYLLFTAITGVAIGIPLGIIDSAKGHHHFQKSIELYNEEIIKRNK